MPIYEQSYRNYEGKMRRRMRWRIVLEQELRILVKSRVFLIILLLGLLHVILRILQVVAYDIIMQDVNNPLTPVLSQFQAIMVNERMFFDFIRLQTFIVFVACLFSGPGMICNDFRNNLMEVYFSKPIRWYDYALGKILTLVTIGLLLTAVPGIFLVFQHNMLAPSWELLRQSWWWPFAILAFSLVVTVPAALGVLASSALLSGKNYAAVAVMMVLFANSAMGGILATALRDRNYLIVAFPMALNRVGQAIFKDHRLAFDLAWYWAFLFVVAVSVISGWIVFRKARRAEVAA